MTYWHAAVLCAVMVVMEAILSWHGVIEKNGIQLKSGSISLA